MQDKNYNSSFLSKPKTPTSQQKYKLPMLTGRIILINFWPEYTGEFVWTAEMEKPHWSTLSSWWSHLDVLFPANTTKILGFIAFEAWLLHQRGKGRILSLSFNHKLSHASFPCSSATTGVSWFQAASHKCLLFGTGQWLCNSIQLLHI